MMAGLEVGLETLRRWLIEEELWQPRARREQHRRRRERRACFGELVQMDTSIHDWTEGRGEPMVLVNMIVIPCAGVIRHGSPMHTR